MRKKIRILMLEDNEVDAQLVQYALQGAGLTFALKRVETKVDYLEELDKHPPDLILLDYSLPGFDGVTALNAANERVPGIPCIFVTGTLGEEVVIEMLKAGATDYVLKTRLSRLAPALSRALRESSERADRRKAEERLRRSYEQLRALSVYLQHVREDERIRISRQVHDELGHALTSLKIDLYWLANRLPTKGKGSKLLHQKTKAMSEQIDHTIQTVRRIATELRPGILDDLGLGAALEWEANQFQKRTGIQCLVASDLKDPIMDEDLNTAFFRIFQETLTNVIRHAHASRVEVNLTRVNNDLVMDVQDNGRGISEAEISNTKSIGLLGMRERAALLGGELSIAGQPGKGTRVTVRIPLVRGIDQHHHENPYRRRSRSSPAWVEANSSR